MDTRCVVFLDEASLPDEKQMVLKVLHPYLDECKVAFVAIANKAFDAANANRMICIYRSLPSEDDQKILAYGCLGLQINHNQLDNIIYGLCQGYRQILQSPDIPHIFHDRDFIYMLRELRFELSNIHEEQGLSVGEITPSSLLRALEDNFNGIKQHEFEKLVNIFFKSIDNQCPKFSLTSEYHYRNIPTILRQSMKLDSKRRKLYGRYKLVIDESEDESAVHLLFQSGILDRDPKRTTVFRMADFPDDINNELRNVEMLSTIKLCMETGKTILMINTGRIHGSLYDVFNQNFAIMATDDTRKIFSKVAIGPKTIDVVVHENFQCIVHIKRSEFKEIPAPFLSRFQKYALSVTDFYSIHLKQLPNNDQILIESVKEKLLSFIKHFGQQYFYGLNDSTLYSCLLTLIKKDENEQYYLSNIHRNYSQLTIQSKSFIEQNSTDIQQSLFYYLLSKLLQILSPESMIYKLPTFNNKFARLLYDNYFYQQEHFKINDFIQQILSFSSNESENIDTFSTEDLTITTKLMISTRTSAFATTLNNESKIDLLNMHETIDVINLTVIENSVKLKERFETYEQDLEKQILIIVIDGRISHQRLHIPFIRQMIDKSDESCQKSEEIPRKFFLILIHSTRQELDHQLSFPSIFLHDWDYYFLDTSTSGSAFHLQKMLKILTSTFNTHENEKHDETLDNNLYDLKSLFNDCLEDFCSRIQIFLRDLPLNTFKNPLVYEFYQRQTSTHRRVQCLTEILQQSQQLEQRIVNSYYNNFSMNQKSFKKTCQSIYQLSKDILCGKRSNSLVDSLQSQIRASFTNFASNILKLIINDYGLDALFKLSTDDKSYELLLNLIDYSSYSVNDDTEDDNQSSPTINQGIVQLTNHYSCIPQTPLYYLFQQRIKNLADEIKSTLQFNHQESKDDDDNHAELPLTTTTTTTIVYDYRYNDNEKTEYTPQQFRNSLIDSITNDKIFAEMISQSILESYINDTVRMLCSFVEKSFNNNLDQYQKTNEFVSRWLLLTDEDDSESFNRAMNKPIWLLAHVYTFFEYDQHDLLSFYSACRIIDQLDSTQSFYDNIFQHDQITRSIVRENLFRSMFNYLWKNLCNLCSTNHSIDQWIHSYTFISKYYPSDKVLEHIQLVRIKGQIEFMNLAYLIFLNETTPEPKELVLQLLNDTSLTQNDIDGRMINVGTSVCLKLLPIIINTIDKYLAHRNVNNSTLMIDIQQWVISTLKSSNQSCEEEIKYLFKFLNQSASQLSLSMKQFLFDELINILFKLRRQNRPGTNKQIVDFWDRISLLPIICDCITDTNLQNYQLPYHPSIITDTNQKQILFDLFFFYLKRIANDKCINPQLIHKILMSNSPSTNDRRLIPIVEIIFKQLKDCFFIQMTALFFCEKDLNELDQQRINNILNTIITRHLAIDPQSGQLNQYVQLFLSTIITKRSWSYLLNLLKSERFQLLNGQWSNTLYNLLEIKHTSSRNKYLQICHQLQFTLSINNTLSIFPKLHQPYDELSKLIDQCVKNNEQPLQRWKSFTDWIQLKLDSDPDPPLLNSTEIKVMLLLNIYYVYYCNNQLILLDTLLTVIENYLQPLPEELRVFRVFLQPEQNLVGYPIRNNNVDENQLNNLFKLDCIDEDELNIRHSLVNLLAMILLGGKQNFLWTFTFEPLELENTFGFGSTRHQPIQADGVHYDCGCLFTENGDLIQFPNSRGNRGALSVPAAYIAYFSTFGALAWHLLLFDESTDNLYGPILSKLAIDDASSAIVRMIGDSIRAKVCHFVRARLLSTYNLLSIHSNQDDACMLLNRCFEQMAQLTQLKNLWIQPIYTTFEEKFQAEQEYQNQIFYPIHQQLNEYKKLMSNLYLQSQIQKNLQDYVCQMPILIQFKHFKTELCNPNNIQLSLNILRNILDSFDFLRITYYIYDLSEFYLLLHQTYTQLIERDEFTEISLKQLYERGQKRQKNANRLNYQNQTNQHLTIIEKGIQAVNNYHKFADGLIRPGACDETQRFQTISIETPISYLLTTENHDEGDIIMRILSVLIDYHNNLLDLLQKEINNNNEHNGISLLKDLIDQLTTRELSIAQIVQENTGVITLNDQDCLWIERLSQASLEITEEYFPQSNVQMNFNFLYIQFYIIRSYLLVCRINYHHIHQKYQCYTRRPIIHSIGKQTSENSVYTLNDPQFNYLQEMSLGQLFNEYNLLQKLIDLLNHYQDERSNMNLHEFIRTTNNNNEIIQQIDKCGIKDFPLCYIEDICQLYKQLINNFHHSILNVGDLLRISIDDKQNLALDQLLDETLIQSCYHRQPEDLQSIRRTITEFLKELKDNEDTLLQQSSQSLAYVCKSIGIENSIVSIIPNDIKCENYISLIIKLIEIRSKLQEQAIKIEETNKEKWNDSFDKQKRSAEEPDGQQNTKEMFDLFFDAGDDTYTQHIHDDTYQQSIHDDTDDSDDRSGGHEEIHVKTESDIGVSLEPEVILPSYISLFEINIKNVPVTASILFEKIRNQQQQTEASLSSITKTLKFEIIYPDNSRKSIKWGTEKIYQRLKAIFEEKRYNFDEFIIVDKNLIFVNFLNENNEKLSPRLSSEYHIIQKTSLIPLILEFQAKEIEYLVTLKCQISSIMVHFIIDHRLTFASTDTFLGLFDELGSYIDEDKTIENIYHSNNTNTIRIRIIKYEDNTSNLSEITLTLEKEEQGIDVQQKLFHPRTKWQQIDLWLKTTNIFTESYSFCDQEQRIILNEDQTLSSTSCVINGVNNEEIMNISLSYDTNRQHIRILKSCPMSDLLYKQYYLQQLNVQIPSSDCILVEKNETNDKILMSEDLKKSIENYSSVNNEEIHFQIAILIQIIQYDNNQLISLNISNRNITIEQLLNLIPNRNEIYQYLASYNSRIILSNDEKLIDLIETKFYLVKTTEICSIRIDQSTVINQQYTIFATIDDLYKQNKDIINDQYLIFDDAIALSKDTPLTCFQQIESPIQFIVSNQNLQINITIINEEQDDFVLKFLCSSSITIDRLFELACQLFHVNRRFYELADSDGSELDGSMSLYDFFESLDDIKFKFISIAEVKCLITYENRTVIIPANKTTMGSIVFKEALEKFFISQEHMNMYELQLLDDLDNPSEIDVSMAIEDIIEDVAIQSNIIPFQLMKK